MSTDARTTSLIAMHSMYEKKNEEFWHNELAANTECHEALHTMQGETTGWDIYRRDWRLWCWSFRNFFQEPGHDRRSSSVHRCNTGVRCTTRGDNVDVGRLGLVLMPTKWRKLIAQRLIIRQCQLDPGFWVSKERCWLLTSFIALLFNRSLRTSYFPGRIFVRPLLEKNALDAGLFQNSVQLSRRRTAYCRLYMTAVV